jgi:hypothetical protein
MRARLFVVLSLALILYAIFPSSPSATHTQSSVALTLVSPPAGLELPVGQGIEVRSRWQAGSPVTIEFLIDGARTETKQVPPGGFAAMSWVPGQLGPHVLELVVRMGGRELTRTTRHVLVIPSDSPVHIP